jgi:hypothetical protein
MTRPTAGLIALTLLVTLGTAAEAQAPVTAALQGKCFDAAIKEIKLPKYEKWGNYEAFLPGNIERFCEYWGRGY